MKIAIPVDHNCIDSTVCSSYSHAPYFMLYDFKTNEYQFLLNRFDETVKRADITATQILADQQVHILVTKHCARHTASLVNDADIRVYRAKYDTIQENIDAFERNELEIMTELRPDLYQNSEQ
ncbi:MAG: NifB/NifX family molybdenum-iron cluster-binding protein [Lachnospiraceae bacterium]|nr:hypothetical protein [Robinsoniella sp.]MDY3765841.1 NifB/NifX family molybdenum-iron cluster-binding protein [Lachnospiraceae bacterium]